MIGGITYDIKEPLMESSIIKVIGVGGGGGNAVNYMYNNGNIKDVDMIICNTDKQALEKSSVPTKIQFGEELTRGLGAGADPDKGKAAAIESIESIKKAIDKKTAMVFITATMGGGTGSGAAPEVAKAIKDLDEEILSIAVVTTPFKHEGSVRIKNAYEGIEKIRPHVDSMLIIDNAKTTQYYSQTAFSENFDKVDSILSDAVKSISDIITKKGHINLDFADVKTVLTKSEVALIGYASASGENRITNALQKALDAPLIKDNNIKGARKTLINVVSPPKGSEFEILTYEFDELGEHLEKRAGEIPERILGITYDNNLTEEVIVTVIVTGFDKHNETVFNISENPDFDKKPDFSLQIIDDNDIIIPDKFSTSNYSNININADSFEEIPAIDRIS